jgi:hypothetical protein
VITPRSYLHWDEQRQVKEIARVFSDPDGIKILRAMQERTPSRVKEAALRVIEDRMRAAGVPERIEP